MKILSIGILATSAILTPLGKLTDADKVVDEKGLVVLTNSVRQVKDEATTIVWKQVMWNNNLYYVAVTNAPSAEVTNVSTNGVSQ